MPFAGYKNFGDCMSKVKAKTKEGKQKICGKLQAQHKKLELRKIKEIIHNERNDIKKMLEILYEKKIKEFKND